MEDQAADLRLPLRLRRRHLPQEELGRGLRERRGAHRDRRERGRIPRGHRLRGGVHGVGGQLARVPAVAARPRPEGREDGHRRQVRRHEGALAEVFPEAPCQRCTVHFHRNALSKAPARRRKRVAAQLKAIHAQESLGAGLRKAEEVAREPEPSKPADAAKAIREGVAEALAYARFPMEHWRRIRTNNGIERLNREVKWRTNAVGSFPDGRSAMMPAAARCEYVADGTWGKRRYLDISLLDHWDERSVSTE